MPWPLLAPAKFLALILVHDPSRSPVLRNIAGRISQLWQLPLFLVSVGLFVYAGYLFINPGPGATVDQKIAVAREYLKQDRPDAAWQQLTRLLESEKLDREKEAPVHLMLAEALAAVQLQQKLNIPANHQRIIEQTEIGLEQGAKADAAVHRRLGDSYAALGAVRRRSSIIARPSRWTRAIRWCCGER